MHQEATGLKLWFVRPISEFFWRVMELSLQEKGSLHKEQGVLLVFLIHCFNSLEEDLIREQIQRLVSLPIWHNILPGRRDEIFKTNPRYIVERQKLSREAMPAVC